jgi:hypothetical protein
MAHPGEWLFWTASTLFIVLQTTMMIFKRSKTPSSKASTQEQKLLQ